MGLPINIVDLVGGSTIESERLEFKKGWNPEAIIRSMCAFANDLHNWGGGYIIIGIDEIEGQSILPPEGIKQNQLNSIQNKILELGNKITPNYHPITKPYIFQNKHILILWCPAGDNRPYEAPETLGKGAKRNSYIRIGSNSVIAKGDKLRQLQELAARIPFDDRVNNLATLNNLDLGLIRQYLQEINSSLFDESAVMPFPDLCRAMFIAKGPDESILPVNVGLLFFCKTPEQFFKRAWIELVLHDDCSGEKFKEIYFKGPIQQQLQEVLSFFKSNIIKESVVKMGTKAESDRFFNYPFKAIKEALSNAVYHKSYESVSPIEVQVRPDQITILSHPGPVPPVNAKILSIKKQIIAREYRNRRIGDFLKELRLTEGRGTGFPTIYRAMEANNSPKPSFDTDDVSYMLVTIPAHVSNKVANKATNKAKTLIFKNLEDIIDYCNGATNKATNKATNQARGILEAELSTKVEVMLDSAKDWINCTDLFIKAGLSQQFANRKKYLYPLIDIGWIQREYPDKLTHPNQRYITTQSGMNLLKLMT